MEKGAKIVVTGGAGFIGSHLVDRLVHDQAGEIMVYDNFSRGLESNVKQHVGNPQVQVMQADLLDYPNLEKSCAGAKYIFHLGAQSNVMGSVQDPDSSFRNNVNGTLNVLKAAQYHQVQRVVFTSSREVYGDARSLPVEETHPTGGKNHYGASKAAGEIYCQLFSGELNTPVSILRLANVYGERDYGRVIPLWIGQAVKGENLTVYGGKQEIDFIWIDIVVEALLRAAEYDVVGCPINIGSGQGTSILDLGRRIIEISGSKSKLEILPARSAEVVRFAAHNGRMRSLLNLQPPDDPLYGLYRMMAA